jgi:prevent-host-death family protein
MDFQELKQLINSNGERIILVENGKPTIVLMSFEDYRKMAQGSESREIEKPEIQNNQIQENRERKELTLDDLPF